MDWHSLLNLLQSDTFWSAVGALATFAATAGIFYAAGQFRFEAWNKCQEVFTEPGFTDARKKVFAHLDTPDTEWSEDHLAAGRIVCGKMDELCRLARFFGRGKMVEVWGNPIAKAWSLLEWMVVRERSDTEWHDKWKAFEVLGERAISKQPPETANKLGEIRRTPRARMAISQPVAKIASSDAA